METNDHATCLFSHPLIDLVYSYQGEIARVTDQVELARQPNTTRIESIRRSSLYYWGSASGKYLFMLSRWCITVLLISDDDVLGLVDLEVVDQICQ